MSGRRARERRTAARAGSVANPVEKVFGGQETPAGALTPLSCTQLWRSTADPLAEEWPRWDGWYGSTPAWRALEASARQVFGGSLKIIEHRDRLQYRVLMDVHGPNDLIEVTVNFYAKPRYDTFGLRPQDYPRVYAQPGRASKHRMPDDDALCLFYPADWPWLRWTAEKGLLDLLYITQDHLLCEQHWRVTGGHQGGMWPAAEAEHGFTGKAA